jgi:hypothetical protein
MLITRGLNHLLNKTTNIGYLTAALFPDETKKPTLAPIEAGYLVARIAGQLVLMTINVVLRLLETNGFGRCNFSNDKRGNK